MMALVRPDRNIITPTCLRCGCLRREYLRANRRRLGVGWLHGACNCCGGCIDQQLQVVLSGVDAGLHSPCRQQDNGPTQTVYYYMDSLGVNGTYVLDYIGELGGEGLECLYRLRLGQSGSSNTGDCYNVAAFEDAEDFGEWKASETELAGEGDATTGCPGAPIQNITTQYFQLIVNLSRATGKITNISLQVETIYFLNSFCDELGMSCGGFSWSDTAVGEGFGVAIDNEITIASDPTDAYSTTGTATVTVYEP